MKGRYENYWSKRWHQYYVKRTRKEWEWFACPCKQWKPMFDRADYIALKEKTADMDMENELEEYTICRVKI